MLLSSINIGGVFGFNSSLFIKRVMGENFIVVDEIEDYFAIGEFKLIVCLYDYLTELSLGSIFPIEARNIPAGHVCCFNVNSRKFLLTSVIEDLPPKTPNVKNQLIHVCAWLGKQLILPFSLEVDPLGNYKTLSLFSKDSFIQCMVCGSCSVRQFAFGEFICYTCNSKFSINET